MRKCVYLCAGFAAIAVLVLSSQVLLSQPEVEPKGDGPEKAPKITPSKVVKVTVYPNMRPGDARS